MSLLGPRAARPGRALQLFAALTGAVFLAAGSGASSLEARSPARQEFVAYDLHIDPKGQDLAAWQIEVRARHAKVVGVEGGEHVAFRDAPYYDRRALSQGLIKLAAFQLEQDFPTKRTRVARLHFAIEAGRTPELAVELQVASTPEGKIAGAEVSIERKR